jgi:integrase/recombinase XerD
MADMGDSTALPGLIQRFFVEYLPQERGLSPATVASYRDTFKLLLGFASTHCKRSPVELAIADLDATVVLAFLENIETNRGNCARSRNTRLAAIHTFARFASRHALSHVALLQALLAIPSKRHDQPLLGYLSREEIDAIIAAPDASTWLGQRDAALFVILYNTGARITEVLALKVHDLMDAPSPRIHLLGKGRKQRIVPLWPTTSRRLRAWIARADLGSDAPLFPNRHRQPMTRSNAAQSLDKAVAAASRQLPQLAKARVSPHTIRHTTAMHLLQAGIDISVIAIWLGHESPTTTHLYIEADLEMKRRALESVRPVSAGSKRFKVPDRLLAFLDAL